MKRKILSMLGVIAIPVGAILLNACGPVESADKELALDEASSDNWIFVNGNYSEYGRCLDGWDNDGDGLADSYDPDCHINAGPLRDLSLFDFPQGHNFFPDISKTNPASPGFAGGFRDREQIIRWFRFLTEPDGNVAGIDLINIGVNPEVVPIPMMSPERINQGTFAQGNNNNVSLRATHAYYLNHGFPPLNAPAAAGNIDAVAQAPSAEGGISAGTEFMHDLYMTTQGITGGTTRGYTGGWPGLFYRAGGPFGGNGSQGALKPARNGNKDD